MDKHHIAAPKDVLELVISRQRSVATHLGVGSPAQPLGQIPADAEFVVGVAHGQGLRIRVDSDELHTLQTRFEHAVDGIGPRSAHTDHSYDRREASRGRYERAPRGVGRHSGVRQGIRRECPFGRSLFLRRAAGLFGPAAGLERRF